MNYDDVAGVILAGGQASRMGGVNKGAQILGTQSLASLILHKVQPQVSDIYFSANEFFEDFQSFGYPVFKDLRLNHQGPLAGIEAVMSLSGHKGWFFCTPVDTPFLPLDIVRRLLLTVSQEKSLCTYPIHQEKKEPLHCLLHYSLLPSLSEFLDNGGRSVWRFLNSQKAVETVLPHDHTSFLNFNTLEELNNLNQTLVPEEK